LASDESLPAANRAIPLAVFAGPSLPAVGRVECSGVSYLPPARRGDIAKAARHYRAILLIDGVFHHDLAPSPREVYAATQAVATFGAASIGALRGAECRPYGMVTLGVIARWYVSGVIDGDDEVAVLVDPRTQRALTVPLVNVRYVARLCVRRGLLSADEGQALINDARQIFYMDRQWVDVVAGVTARKRADVLAIARRDGDLKRLDATFALRSVARRLGVPLSNGPVWT
jgi:hypothetical protein